MTSLTDLWMQGNKIRIIPNTIKKLQRLKRLELSGNQIFTIPREIGHLVKLESLFLSANKLTDAGIPNKMIYMTSLKTLYLQGNLILRRPGVLKEMQLNGNLKVCQIGVGAVIRVLYYESLLKQRRGQMRTSIQLQFEPLASTMKTAVVVLTLKNLRCLLKIWACI